ncbi:STAS domain-containing protein [Actinomadura sp. GTD37]|uniref:STAS domain-containing protein n=1 Tax=Actinomadura sp. GTD37 TaxID=1778030 RepID=UPI0035BF02EE
MTLADKRPHGARPALPPTTESTVTCANGALLLTVDAHPDGTTVELRLSGELDVAGSGDLRRHIGAVIAAHDPHRLVLDLSRLSFADSSGLAAIVWAHKAMSGRGGRLRLHHPHPRVLRVLHITGLHTRLHITEADAAEPCGPLGAHRRPAR